MQPLLLLLSLFCLMGVMGQQTIIYIDQSLNWTDAQVYCRKYHTDLVTIKNGADNDQIDENSWLGLYRENSDAAWKWSRGDEPLTFTITWKNGFPNTGENCVYKHKGDNGPWRSNDCNENYEFFCVDETLVLVREMKTWEQALVHCRSMEGGHSYDLASVITQEDHDYALSMIENKVWIGLRFLGDQWTWVGGEEVQYHDITSCPDNERCGTLDKTSTARYNIAKCEEQQNFFCYRRPGI